MKKPKRHRHDEKVRQQNHKSKHNKKQRVLSEEAKSLDKDWGSPKANSTDQKIGSKRSGRHSKKKRKDRSLIANGVIKNRSLKANSVDDDVEEGMQGSTEALDDLDEDEDQEQDWETAERERKKQDKKEKRLFAKIKKCQERIRQAGKGHREELYAAFSDLYRAAAEMAQDLSALQYFMSRTDITECSAAMPDSPNPAEWLVFAVKFAFWGPSKDMQKRASKFTSIAEFLVSQGISPDDVLTMLRKYRIRRLVEMSARRRAQGKLLQKSTPSPPVAPPVFDKADISEEYRDVGRPAAVMVLHPDDADDVADEDLADEEAPDETSSVKSSFDNDSVDTAVSSAARLDAPVGISGEPARGSVSQDRSKLIIQLGKETSALLRGLRDGRRAFLLIEKQGGTLVCVDGRPESQKM
jgi:hypothetical protein